MDGWADDAFMAMIYVYISSAGWLMSAELNASKQMTSWIYLSKNKIFYLHVYILRYNWVYHWFHKVEYFAYFLQICPNIYFVVTIITEKCHKLLKLIIPIILICHMIHFTS